MREEEPEFSERMTPVRGAGLPDMVHKDEQDAKGQLRHRKPKIQRGVIWSYAA